MDQKTSTFTIHHDRCDPSKWTPADVLALAKFIETGNLGHAAHLSRLGMQLVLSEHHTPKGGELEQIGWTGTELDGEYADDINDLYNGEDVIEVQRVYRGPVEFCVPVPVADEAGNIEGHEYDVFPTEAEADALASSLRTPETPN